MKPPSPPGSPSSSLPHGFSLTELLCVTAILAMMLSLSTFAFHRIGKAATLSAAGNRVTAAIRLAGQHARSQSSQTAVVVLEDSSFPQNGRMYTLMELASPRDGSQPGPADWRQLTNWETLPDGILIEFPDPELSFRSSNDQPSTPFPPLQIEGRTVTRYRYTTFLPSGRLGQSSTAVVRLSEGYYQPEDHLPVHTHAGTGGVPLNYYSISILAATGRTKIERP